MALLLCPNHQSSCHDQRLLQDQYKNGRYDVIDITHAWVKSGFQVGTGWREMLRGKRHRFTFDDQTTDFGLCCECTARLG
ncbi:Uncharacterised protein [Vibrio cholerae]|nr:Uncharacterised protein [Vibrio cholerae]CSH87609.1 Uncharacterised protein [Vibrio cholerae]